MNSLFDILLLKPLQGEWLKGLLFAVFSLHLTFVLLAIGTAIISLYYFIKAWWQERLRELRWDKEMLKTFLAHKSLAVVLGLAPLLLIQVGFSVPFFTAVNLLAPFWLGLVVLLMAAFLSFDVLGHKIYVHDYWHLLLGIIGLVCLLAIPGIFVAVLVTAENSDKWLTIIQNGFHLTGPLAWHWLFRYLHVLGAGLVFGASFHYFFSTRDEKAKKKSLLLWLMTGLLLQIILGLLLYRSLPAKPGPVVNIFLFVGISAAILFLWFVFYFSNKGLGLSIKTVVPLLMLTLTSMLLARQALQDKKFLPLEKQLGVEAKAYQKKLEAYERESIETYQADLNIVYDRGETIYARSCAFCHGENAAGDGPEAVNLSLPPENLSALRVNRQTLQQVIVSGVPGSAMPYFAFFERSKIEGLTNYLDLKYAVFSPPGPLPAKIPEAALEQAQKIYDEACSLCHGRDGRGSKQAKQYRPAVPDFTVYNLTPQRAFAVISNGYPGTMMPAFGQQPEDVRWGLVKIVNDKKMTGEASVLPE
jgi:mono/diheme cytochrome c family protein